MNPNVFKGFNNKPLEEKRAIMEQARQLALARGLGKNACDGCAVQTICQKPEKNTPKAEYCDSGADDTAPTEPPKKLVQPVVVPPPPKSNVIPIPTPEKPPRPPATNAKVGRATTILAEVAEIVADILAPGKEKPLKKVA